MSCRLYKRNIGSARYNNIEMVTEAEIRDAYETLFRAREELSLAEEVLVCAENALLDREAELLSSNEIEGRSEDIRKAKLRVATKDLRDVETAAAKARRTARLKLQSANDRVQMLSSIIRVKEAQKEHRPQSAQSQEEASA